MCICIYKHIHIHTRTSTLRVDSCFRVEMVQESRILRLCGWSGLLLLAVPVGVHLIPQGVAHSDDAAYLRTQVYERLLCGFWKGS